MQLRYAATNVSLSQLEAALKESETTAVYLEWSGEAENSKARQAISKVSAQKPVQILCYNAAGDGEQNPAALQKLQLRLGIKILPSLLLVRNGQVIRRLEGAQAIVGGIPLFLQIGRMEEYAFFEVPIWPRDGKNNL